MTLAQATIGTRVRTLHAFAGIPVGTEAVIDETYEIGGRPGVMVAWDIPDHPLPPNYPQEYPHPKCRINLLRDGFSEGELQFLEVV